VTDDKMATAALEPLKGPQVSSKGVASEDAVEVSHASVDAEVPFST